MKRLIVVRHGIAVARETAGMLDEERPLTSKGERRIREIAKGLKVLEIDPERIVSSPLPRALRTAELIAEELDGVNRLETSDMLRPESTASSVRTWLETRLEDSLMIVGHNPSLTDFVGLAIGLNDAILPFELKKGGVASFEILSNRYVLEWMATPRLLRTRGA